MTFINCEQNTEEWFDLRLGKVTGSAISKIMANYGKAFGNPAKDLAVDLAVEQLTGKRKANNYSNSHMERGHEEEPIARALYEDKFFVDVLNGGFYDNDKTGCSPDGNVSTYGLIEIKSAIPSIHYARIKKGTFDSSYKWQLAFNLKETGREWIDFVSFCSTFPISKRLYTYRITKEDFKEEFSMIDLRLELFFDLLNKIKEDIK